MCQRASVRLISGAKSKQSKFYLHCQNFGGKKNSGDWEVGEGPFYAISTLRSSHVKTTELKNEFAVFEANQRNL